jgi:predicted RND superfamily exporter protein
MTPSRGIRERIEAGFERWGHFVFRHARLTLGLMALLTVALGSHVSELTLDTSTEGFLHQDDPTRHSYEAFRRQFGQDGVVIIGICPPEVFDLGFLEELRNLHAELETEVPNLEDIHSLVNARSTRGQDDELIVEDLLEDWPTDEVALANFKQRVLANPFYENLLISRNAGWTTVAIRLATFSALGSTTDVMDGFEELADSPRPDSSQPFLTGEEITSSIAAIENVVSRHDREDFRIFVSGEPVLVEKMQQNMRSDITRFVALSILAIAVFLWVLFRRFFGVLLPLTVVLLALLCTLGTMAWCGVAIRIATEILPSFLLAVGVGASMHLLAVFFQSLERGLDKEDALAHALGHSGLAILMTSLTTAGGLVSFWAAELAPIAEFGVFAPIGVMMTLLFSVVLLPALIAVTPLHRRAGGSRDGSLASLDRLLMGFGNTATAYPWTVLGVSTVIVAVSLLGAMRLRTSYDPMSWFPETFPFRIATETIDREFQGSMVIEVLIETPDENGLYDPELLGRLESLRAYTEALEFNGLRVGKAISIADIVKEINQALNENQPAYYSIPSDRRLVAQELLLFENTGADDLEDVVDARFSRARFTLRVPYVNATRYPPFIDHIEEHFARLLGDRAEVEVTGIVPVMSRVIDAVIVSLMRSYVIAFVVITPLMIFLIGSMRGGLLSMIPNLFPVIVTLGVMGWFDFPLDPFTLLIGCIAIGLAVDDTIHFMHNFQRYYGTSGDARWAVQEPLQTTGRALLFTTLILSTGFFLYMFSSMRNVFEFGFLTGFCLIVAFLADVLLAPALMVLVRGRNPKLWSEPLLGEGASQ